MELLKLIKPPENWRLPVILISGIIVGLFIYTFYLSKAHSYISDDPKTCVNCHIMAPQYATWNHSAHREVTNCNDCHVPHNNILNKYYFKAKDGLRHATMFTMRKEPQVIYIHDAGKEVVQENCIRCHSDKITDTKILTLTTEYHQYRTERKCWECHRETPHGRVNSLSSVPYARVPLPETPVPDWLKRVTEKN